MRKENLYPYHLIDEEQHSYGFHEESGWDTDHRGAGQCYEPTSVCRNVKSIGNGYPTFRRRNITEEFGGKVTFEGTLRIVSGDGFYFGFWGDKGDEKEAFVLRQNKDSLFAGKEKVCDFGNEWHYIKLVLDIDKKETAVHLDGKYLVTLPFTGKAKTLCRLEYGYEKDAAGEANVNMTMQLYKNYLFLDDIVPRLDGQMPEEYEIDIDGKAEVLRHPYRQNSKYFVYEVSANKDSDVTITRRFAKSKGKVCFEMRYLLEGDTGKLTVSMLCGKKDAFSVYDGFCELWCRVGLLRKHSKNVWQTLRIEADTNENTALVRLNGKVVSSVAFDYEAGFVDGVKIGYVARKTGGVMLGDLSAFVMPPLPSDYVPEPVIPEKKGDYYVGMNICSLWRTGTHYGWDCITPYEDNKPYLGWYDEGNPETADWELKFMAEHGIDFQLYCWYASESDRPMIKTPLASAIHSGHMLAKYSDKVKMALLWEAQSGMRPASFDAFKKYYVPYFIDYFFSDSRYMHIDGNAIMSIYGIWALVRDLGGEQEVKKCLDYLRREVKKLGYRDLVVLCCGDSSEQLKRSGIDGVHAYNWGKEGYDVEYTKRRINGSIEEGSVHTVPTVSMGYNLVAWANERSEVLEPSDMKTLLEWCRDEVLSKQDKKSWKSKLVMLSTWNEYGEGTYMMPAPVHGFGYLDAVREVFMKNVPHADVRPSQNQLDRICILHPQDRKLIAPLETIVREDSECALIRRYEFKTEKDLEKWEIHKLTNYEIRDGRLCGHSDVADPYMILHDDEFLPISTEKIGKIVAHCRTYKPVNATCCIQCSYMFEKDKWYPVQSACLSVPDRVAPLAVNPAESRRIFWHGDLMGFRFDPVWAEGDFELESIEFYAAPPHNVFSVNGRIIDMSYTPYVDNGIAYIPFDTRSELRKLSNMYYSWNEENKSLEVCGEKCGVFKEGSGYAEVDGKKITLAKPVAIIDGIPHLQGDVFADLLGMKLTVDGLYIKLDNK